MQAEAESSYSYFRYTTPCPRLKSLCMEIYVARVSELETRTMLLQITLALCLQDGWLSVEGVLAQVRFVPYSRGRLASLLLQAP
jgi:hypothetical protein